MTHDQVYMALLAVKNGRLDLAPDDAKVFWEELRRIADEQALGEVLDVVEDEYAHRIPGSRP